MVMLDCVGTFRSLPCRTCTSGPRKWHLGLSRWHLEDMSSANRHQDIVAINMLDAGGSAGVIGGKT